MLVLTSAIVACDKPQQAKPDVEVVVAKANYVPHQTSVDFVGQLTASSDIKIQARVKARIEKIHFDEGKEVAEGDILFVLNDDELQAQYRQVKAEVSKSQAALDSANKNYRRGLELEPDGYISSSELDQLEDKVAESNALLESANAKLENAAVNLSYTQIEAPISGKIDRAKFKEGDLVSPDVGSLTTIVAVNTMEVPFQLSEKLYWKIVRRIQKSEQKTRDKSIVEIAFSRDDIYEHQGSITFVSNRVNPETGSMEVRASIPNPDGILKPGQHVTVILKSPKAVDTLMIQQAAVQSDQQGDYVLMVDPENKVVRKNVLLGERVDTLVIVNQGLEEGQNVIIRGVQRVRPGQKVKAVAAGDPNAVVSPDIAQQS